MAADAPRLTVHRILDDPSVLIPSTDSGERTLARAWDTYAGAVGKVTTPPFRSERKSATSLN